jgi:hypothetical protein
MPPRSKVDPDALVRPWLEDIGFRRRAPRNFIFDGLADSVIGWVGLNTAHEGLRRGVVVNPIVGVRHQEVEAITSKLRGAPDNGYHPRTVQTSLGHVLPRFTQYLFDGGPADPDTATTMAAHIEDHGVPWMRSHCDLETMVDALEEPVGPPRPAQFSLPVALVLLGRRDEAVAGVMTELERDADAEHPAADEYRRFAAAFFDFIGARRDP